MKALTTSIYGICASGTTLHTSIGGRMFKNYVPNGTAYPYIVFYVISDVPSYTFSEEFETVLVQFSIFSEAEGTTEIEDIYTNLKALYDNVTFSPTGNKVVIMTRQNATLSTIEADVPNGTGKEYQYDVDYEVFMQKTS